MHESKGILAADGLDDVLRWCSQQFCNDRKLVDMIFAGEEWLALQHLSKNAARAPNIHLDVVLLPCKHNFRGAIVSSRNVASHLRILDSSEAEIANLEVTVLIDQNVAGLEISMDDTGAVDVFQSSLGSHELKMTCATSSSAHTRI